MSTKHSTDKLVETAAEAVRALDLAIERYRGAYAHAQHITVSDSLVMSHLSNEPDRRLTPTELSARLAMSSGTLTTVIDRLEASGYAERQPNPQDGRSVLVALTDAGMRSLTANRTPLVQAIGSIVPAEHLQAFADYVDAIAERLETAADELGSR